MIAGVLRTGTATAIPPVTPTRKGVTPGATAAITLRLIDMVETSAADTQIMTTAAAAGGRGMMTTGAVTGTAMQKMGGCGRACVTLTSAAEGSGNEPAASTLTVQTLITLNSAAHSA